MSLKKILEIQDLQVQFPTFRGTVQALDGVTFDINEGETVGLVGETGCGKSVTGLSILRLIPPPGRITSGKVLFEGEDLMKKTEDEVRKIRGSRIAMIFQDPTTSLNPVFTVAEQMGKVIQMHQKLNSDKALDRTSQMLELVGVSPESRAKNYPHELSGGMKQRVMIAMSLSCNPSLIIADEPTTALDVTIQAQILELMKELKEKFNTSMLLITHDLGVIAEMCDRVAVMYAGSIVEAADVSAIFAKPMHPYTRGLMNAVVTTETKRDVDLQEILGTVPNLIDSPRACLFNPRCLYAQQSCRESKPELIEIEPGHFVACPIMPFAEHS